MDSLESARKLAELSSARKLPSYPVALMIDDDDEEVEFAEGDYGFAEGQTFIIEYVDSKGGSSRRPITVVRIEAGAGGVPLLFARCHIRKTTRNFRVDRISCCIDFDGEIFDDVPGFMVESLGMHPGLANASGRHSDALRWRSILDIIRPDAIIMAAVGWSDEEFLVEERSAAILHMVALSAAYEVTLDAKEIAAARRYLSRLKPNSDDIVRALDIVADRGQLAAAALMKACIAIMDADGLRNPQEIALINELATHFFGVQIG